MKILRTRILIAAALGGALAVTSVCVGSTNEPVEVSAVTNSPSEFRSTEDGWLDISGFMDQCSLGGGVGAGVKDVRVIFIFHES